MTGALVALVVFACGLGAVVGMAYIVAPSSLRRRPDDPRAPKVIAAEFQSGRGGHSALWSVPADPGEYSKIWSDDRNQGITGMSDQAILDEIKTTVEGNDVVLFMKGSKNFPQCGFSSRVSQILNYLSVEYKDVNVLESDEMRQGIKDFTNWPTTPQLYVKGEFVGGCDIVTEMTLSGELDQVFAEKGVAFDLEAAKKIRESNG